MCKKKEKTERKRHLKATILQVPSNFLLWNTFPSLNTTVFVQK